MIQNPTFSILITTKNRKVDLAFTLSKIEYLLDRKDVVCVICDDGSTDGTCEFIQEKFSNIQLQRNVVSMGYISCRNKMLNETKADYAISLDDDAHFITENPLELIQNHFEQNQECGLIAMRIYWGLEEPEAIISNQINQQVQGFVGCAHVWRMKTWRNIPNYPEWFVFYGEEDFAAFEMLKKQWEIHYLPNILVNHRVNLKARKNNADYSIRLKRSLRSGWYLLFLFYPIPKIPREFAYSLWVQLKSKVFKGDFKALRAIILALLDLVWNIPKIVKDSNRLTTEEFEVYTKLSQTKLYWQPEVVKSK
jgi:glycosyltransferase involved in cell wall biosynthesis